MSESRTIVLYDIPGNAAKDRSWSPNVWKARFALNYKGLPYRTEWVEYPDVAALAQRVGALHTAVRRDGSLYYTAPIIYDPATQQYVSDSMAIALHLDRTYPGTPQLFPPGSEAFIAMFDAMWMDKVSRNITPLMMTRTHAQLNERSAAYFRATREKMFKAKLEDLATPDKLPGLWEKLHGALGQFDKHAQANSQSNVFFAGAQPTYADVVAAGWLMWVRRIWGEDSKEWKDMEDWHGGRWGRLLAQFLKWETALNGDTHKACL